MSGRRPAEVLASVAAIAAIAAASTAVLYPPITLDVAGALLFTIAVASFSLTGAVLVARVPGNRIGPLLLLAGVLLAVALGGAVYVQVSLEHAGGSWPATGLVAWIANMCYVPPIVIVAGAVPAIFPDGRLVSPRWRWQPVVMLAALILATMTPAVLPGPINNLAGVPNPVGLPGSEPLLRVADQLSSLLAVPVLAGSVGSVVVRWRRGSGVERQQLKWLLAVASIGALGFGLAFLVPDSVLANPAWVSGFIALALLPVAIGVAIQRHRLYDIDRIISRSLGWAIVTAILAGVFVAVVVGLQAVLEPFTRQGTVAVAASTLLAAMLFQPLRGRVQRSIDRRFNRSRVDGERAVARFADGTRDLVEIGQLQRDVLATAGRIVEPTSAAIWLRAQP